MKKYLFLITATTCLITLGAVDGYSQGRKLQTLGGGSLPPSPAELGETSVPVPDDFNQKSVQEIWTKEKTLDEAVVRYNYEITRTFPIRLRQNMHTLIILPEWEEAEAISLGDNDIFKFTRFPDAYDRRNMVIVYADTT